MRGVAPDAFGCALTKLPRHAETTAFVSSNKISTSPDNAGDRPDLRQGLASKTFGIGTLSGTPDQRLRDDISGRDVATRAAIRGA